jgi:hypothetical protein
MLKVQPNKIPTMLGFLASTQPTCKLNVKRQSVKHLWRC